MLKKIILLILMAVIFTLTSGCSNNDSLTGFGPSWDLALQIPVNKGEYHLGNFVGALDYEEFGYEISNGRLESFFIRGTESKPIVKEYQQDLPLKLDLGANYLLDYNMPDLPLSGSMSQDLSIPLGIPYLALGDSEPGYNELTLTINNQGEGIIAELEMEILGSTIHFVNINPEESRDYSLRLGQVEIRDGQIPLSISARTLAPTSLDLSLKGLNKLTVTKVEELPANNVSFANIDISLPLEFADALKLSSYREEDDTNVGAALQLQFKLLNNSDLEIAVADLSLDGQNFTFDGTNYTYGPVASINIGGELSSRVGFSTLQDTLSYDSKNALQIKVKAIGQIEMGNPLEDMELVIEDNYLVWEATPQRLELTKNDVNQIKKGIKSAYLQTQVESSLQSDLLADFYLGSDADNLYLEENKINSSLINISGGENTSNQFFLVKEGADDSLLNRVEELLSNPPVYLGVRFKLGDPDKAAVAFSAQDTLKVEAAVIVNLKVNH